MHAHTRALIAAAAFACVTGKTVAGVHDHAAARDRRIGAECREGRLQGFDGDRGARFGGTLPEVFDSGDNVFISLAISESAASGFDRGSQGHFDVVVSDGLVQVFDHVEAAWFAYDMQDPDAARGYHRG